MTSATIIRKFNALHKKVVSKQFVKTFLDDVQEFIRVKRVDSHGPEGAKVIDIKDRLSKLLPLVNGTDFRLLIDPKVRITPDLAPLKNKVAAYEKKKKFKHKKYGKLSGTYDQYIVAKEKFEKSLNELTDKLNKFPKHPNGLVKERTPEYISVKKEYDKIFSLYRSFNSLPQNKKYSKQFFEAKRKKQLYKSKRNTFKHKSRGKKLSGKHKLPTIPPFVYTGKKPANVIDTMIDNMIENKMHSRTINITTEKGYEKFMRDAKKAINEKRLIVKRNDNKLTITLGSESYKKLAGTTTLKKIKSGVYEFVSSNGDKYVATSTSKDKKRNFDITKNGKAIDNGAAKVSDIRSVIALEIRNSRKGLSGKKYRVKVGDKFTKPIEADNRQDAIKKTKSGLRWMKYAGKKLTPIEEKLIKPGNKLHKNLSGVEYKYHEVDLGEFKKDLHKMFSDTIIQIHGLPGHGKTVYVLKLAQDRASRTGDHVLYVAHEEFGRSTLDLKLKEQKIGHKNLRIRGELTDADAKWATVIILDSVNSLDLTSKGVKKLTERFPNKNWILILQSTKDGKFRGDQTWEHLVDIAGEVRDRKLILSKNRLDPDNKDKMAKLRMDALVHEKTEAARIREKVKYEATKDKLKEVES